MSDDPFDARLTFLVYRVTAKLTLVANRLFRQHGLDIYSSRILLLLRATGDSAVGHLVEAMALPQSTVSHQLLRLQKQGLIERRRAPGDNRVVRVTLTPDGERAADAVERFSARINRAMIDDLDPIERLVMPKALQKLIGTLDNEASLEPDEAVREAR